MNAASSPHPAPSLIECSSTQLTLLRPLADLPCEIAAEVIGWLRAHGLDPARVAVGRPIERNEGSVSVSWREQTVDGMRVHSTFPPVGHRAQWPAPFPATLRDRARRPGVASALARCLGPA